MEDVLQWKTTFGWFWFWFWWFTGNLHSGGSVVQHGIWFSWGWGLLCTHFPSLWPFTSLCPKSHTVALTKLSTTALTHTLTNFTVALTNCPLLHLHTLWPISLLGWWLGRGCADSYISLRGYPLLICGMGEGGSISQSNENDPEFSKLIWDQPLNFLGTYSTPLPKDKVQRSELQWNKSQGFTCTFGLYF